jgi:hypothetical protein
MAVERCDYSDLIKTECAHCKGYKEPPPPIVEGPSFVAQYDGFCHECGDRILPGEKIKRSGENYSHANCDD